MSKSIIIILIVVWLLCAIYNALARAYDYPYQGYVQTASWVVSGLLLLCIILFIKRHKRE